MGLVELSRVSETIDSS